MSATRVTVCQVSRSYYLAAPPLTIILDVTHFSLMERCDCTVRMDYTGFCNDEYTAGIQYRG
jgi:hypothetical protein